MEQQYIKLNDGNRIPQLGLGVYQMKGNEKTKEVCLNALKMGYRRIDTVHAYMNEEGVGQAIKESGIDRKDIWITSKLWISDYADGKAAASIDSIADQYAISLVIRTTGVCWNQMVCERLAGNKGILLKQHKYKNKNSA